MKVSDLPERPRSGVVLYCPRCETTSSACRGDYLAVDPNQHFLCEKGCEEFLVLVVKFTVFQPIVREEGER